jgi:hypothetical protein
MEGHGFSSDSPLLHQIVDPWYNALSNPQDTQNQILKRLVGGYSRTAYGRDHGAASVNGLEDFRRAFPVASYQTFLPYIARVRQGEDEALLFEPTRTWVMTRGTTGASKVIPVGDTHLSEILGFGARAFVNFALKRNMEVVEKAVLNLNFPSRVHQMDSPRGTESYGYSSGTYARFNPGFGGARLVPAQAEIDSLGGGISRADWERRFELAYQAAKGEDIGSLMGVTQVMVAFAEHVKRRHGVKPKEIWKPRVLCCTSVAKIHTKYAPVLRHFYGPRQIVEMYTATEGVFAQQRDGLPYLSPNYDGYLFEVDDGRRTVMLHELQPNRWGKLIVSTSMLPRYEIGDLVESEGKGYFRILGRNRFLTRAEHRLFNLAALRF